MNSWITDVLEHHVSENQENARPTDDFELNAMPTLPINEISSSSRNPSRSSYVETTDF